MEADYFRVLVGRSGTTDLELVAKTRRADVLFVDVQTVGPQTIATVAAGIRRVSTEMKSHAATVVRAPGSLSDAQDTSSELLAETMRVEICRRLRLADSEPSIAVLAHNGLKPAALSNGAALGQWLDPGRNALESLRNAELRALVHHYGALHSSDVTQFVLPNGSASNSFLRMADVLRTRRDCQVVAKWILPIVGQSVSRIGIGTDTPGLLPLAQEVLLQLKDHRVAVEQIVVTDVYPFGGGDLESVFPHLGPVDSFIYLLSVSRSGRFETLIAEAMSAITSTKAKPALVILGEVGKDVDRRESPRDVRRLAFSDIDLPDALPPGELDGRDIVNVAPATFHFQAVPTNRLGVEFPPPPSDLDSVFFSIASTFQCVGIECSPFSTTGAVRPRGRLVSFRVLLEELSDGVTERFRASHEDAEALLNRLHGTALQTSYPVAVIPDADAMPQRTGLKAAAQLTAQSGMAVGKWHVLSELASSRPPRALLFLWGSVTGASTIRSIRRLRDQLPGAQIDCLICHFRPPSPFEATYIERELSGGHLATIWEMVVPWTSSFAPEASRLAHWAADSRSKAREWESAITSRLNVISPTGTHRNWRDRVADPPTGLGQMARHLLWTTNPPSETPQQSLSPSWLDDQPTTLLAAAHVLERLRGNEQPLRIEMKTLVASAPDPEWAAAIFRQSRPGELWFGVSKRQQTDVAEYVCDWLVQLDNPVALAELVAADAVGKLPSAASEALSTCRSSSSDETIRMLFAYLGWSRGAWPS